MTDDNQTRIEKSYFADGTEIHTYFDDQKKPLQMYYHHSLLIGAISYFPDNSICGKYVLTKHKGTFQGKQYNEKGIMIYRGFFKHGVKDG